jgi:DNA helicase HerA-like ATPase
MSFMPGEYIGLGEARMIGIFGKTGYGKSWLAAYILAGYAMNRNMGILILDPQGEFANNFPTSRFPFHQIIKYACNRELTIIRTDEIKLDPENVNDVALFTKKFFEANRLFSTSEEKYRDFLDELHEQILSTEFTPQGKSEINPINPIMFYKKINTSLSEGKIDEVSKFLEIQVNDLKKKLNENSKIDELIVSRVWNRFLDTISRTIVDRMFATERTRDRINERLRALRTDKNRINSFRKYLQLFDPSQGKTVDQVVDLLLTQRRIIIFDISKIGKRFPGMDETELKAFFISRIIEKIRDVAEEKFGGSNLLNVLITMDEAHKYVGSTYFDLPEDLKLLKMQIVKNVKETRKYGIGWLFITQTTVDFDKEIYRQLHDYFFLYGLGVGADLQHMKEVVPKKFIEQYRGLPNPKQTNVYWAMHTGSLNVINTATAATFIRLPSPEEFLRLNFNMDLKDLEQIEKKKKELTGIEVD